MLLIAPRGNRGELQGGKWQLNQREKVAVEVVNDHKWAVWGGCGLSILGPNPCVQLDKALSRLL